MSDDNLASADAAVQSLCRYIFGAGGVISPCVSIKTKPVLRSSIEQKVSDEATAISRSLVAATDIRAGRAFVLMLVAPVAQTPSAGTPLLRVPFAFIITPSLATRIILAHNPLNSSSQPQPSRRELQVNPSFLSPLSPLGLICAAIAIIRCCSRDHRHCPICSPHIHYTSILDAATAPTFLAIDGVTFNCHVQPLLICTPLAESLPRARLELRLQAQEIAKLIGLSVDDVIWAFRYTPLYICDQYLLRVAVIICFDIIFHVTLFAAMSLRARWLFHIALTHSVQLANHPVTLQQSTLN